MAAWVATVEPIAYGPLGLRPWDLDRLTPREFGAMSSAAETEDWRRHELAGWVVMHVLNHLPRRRGATSPVTLDKLLGSHYTAWRLRREQARGGTRQGEES